jgi:hypothetical protein
MIIGPPSRIAESFDPGWITQCFGVMNLAGRDRDAVTDLENETLTGTGHEKGATQNPIGFGDLSVEVGLTPFDDRDGAFGCDFCNHFPLVCGHLDLRARVGV